MKNYTRTCGKMGKCWGKRACDFGESRLKMAWLLRRSAGTNFSRLYGVVICKRQAFCGWDINISRGAAKLFTGVGAQNFLFGVGTMSVWTLSGEGSTSHCSKVGITSDIAVSIGVCLTFLYWSFWARLFARPNVSGW